MLPRGRPGGTRSRVRSRIAGLALALLTATAMVSFSAGPASASEATVKVAGSAWLGGNGVPACAPSTADHCGTQLHVGGVPNNWWQCVELAQRLYEQRGWHSGIFSGVMHAYEIYDTAADLGMSRQANGSITSIVPGDMIVHTSADGGGDGHVSLVSSVSNGTVSTVEQNVNNDAGWGSYTLSIGSLSRTGWHIAGVVHDPDNTNTNGSADADGDGIADTQDVCPALSGVAAADPAENGCPRFFYTGARRLHGDFTGDGKDDVAALYKYPNTRGKLFLFTSTGSGFNSPSMVWDSGDWNWNWGNSKPVSGDFTGDGKADIAVLYKYPNTRSKLFLFTSTGSGFNSPSMVWDSGDYNWNWDNSKPVTGDVNNDGKADITVLYKYPNNQSKLFLFTSTGTGFNSPSMVWDSGLYNWNWDNSKVIAGDFTGDGKDDVAVLYRYPNNQSKLFLFTSTGSGFNSPSMVWDSGLYNWNSDNSRTDPGDFTGDGKADIAAFYKYPDSQTKLWLFTSTGTGFNDPSMAWDSGTYGWNWDNALAA